MGSSLPKPFIEFTKEEIALAVTNIGDPYQGYYDDLIERGVTGSVLSALSLKEVEQMLDLLNIRNRLHRRVLANMLHNATSSLEFVSSSYAFNPSTPSSDLEPYSQITEICFRENRKTAILAGIHLVLNNGNQLSLDTKLIKNGRIVTQKVTVPSNASLCSSIVRDGSGKDYYKIEISKQQIEHLVEVSSSVTYTGYILKSESGRRIGVVCMIDRCSPSSVADTDRAAFLRRMAQETEYQLKLRKHLLERERKLQAQIHAMRHEVVLQAHGPIKPVLKSEVMQRLSSVTSLDRPSKARASHMLPIFQHVAGEAEKAHLPANFFDSIDAASATRPPIPRNDIARCGAVEALGLTEIGPDDEIAVHLKNMVKMATQVFGFPNAVITFHNHETVYRIADYGENEEIRNSLDNLFKSIKKNRDGTRFLCQMPRAGAVCNWSVASEGTFVVQNLADDETFAWMTSFLPIRCYVGTAIKDTSGTVIAVLCLFDSKPRPDFEAAHEIQIEHLASLISQSIENWALTRYIDRLENQRKIIARERNKNGPPNGMVTIVLADIEGAAALWESVPTVMQDAKDTYDAIIKQQRLKHWGIEVETDGDSFALAFHDPVDAFGFALETQRVLFDAKWSSELLNCPDAKDDAAGFRGLRVKIAIHHGTCETYEDGSLESMNFDGETKNLTRNLLSMAQGGQILCTFETWDVASYFMGSILDYPQVVDQGSHVIRKGETIRDGLITKRIIQLLPSNLAFDYFAARRLSSAPEEERHDGVGNNRIFGRHFPPVISLKKVGASFHDAPFQDNVATIALIDDRRVSSVVNLVGLLLDGNKELSGYQCQKEMLVFHRPVDAVLFGLRLLEELRRQEPQADGTSIVKLVKYCCMHDSFLTMGPHRTTGKADYFGKTVNRAARLGGVIAPGTVCFGIVGGKGETVDLPASLEHPLIETTSTFLP